MVFLSTRNKALQMSFQEALFQGLSPDGGLFYPAEMPDMRDIFAEVSQETPFTAIAEKVIHRVLAGEVSREEARNLVQRAFPFAPELKELRENLHILELYHGPSSAFKDFGASFLATAMEFFLRSEQKKAVILTATSGDTGSAVARAFYGKQNIDVVILYPKGRISPLQEKQMTTLGKNIRALEVNGSFDDCQRMVKEAFQDAELSRINLTSANSINLGRLLPQSLYYIWAAGQLNFSEKDSVFCVPSGNFGNLTAGLYAKRWGLPVKRFIASTNRNDVIPEYLLTGSYRPRPSVQTFSNAMDVGSPSNFERMQVLYENNLEAMKRDVKGLQVSDEATLATMRAIQEEHGYEVCPHTAVGIRAAEQYLEENRGDKVTVLSTAHPGKFLEVFEQAVGRTPELPASLLKIKDKQKIAMEIGNSLADLKQTLNSLY